MRRAQRGEATKKEALEMFQKHVGRDVLADALKTLVAQQKRQAAAAQVLPCPAAHLPRAGALTS